MSAMSRNRDDGLSIAVWENSPWRSFVRFRDPVGTADGQAETAPLFRPIQDISQARHQESEDVREIFGRALDVARSRKSFASAASVTSTRKELVMRSEARMMAEDNRSWGGAGRSKWGHREDESSDDLEDFEDDDGDEKDGDNAPQAEQVASPCRPTESSPGPLSRNSSVRIMPPPSPHLRRGTATGSSGAEDADGNGATEWAAALISPASSRAPTRLSLMATGSAELHPQASLAMRTSPHGAPPDGASALGDTAAAAGGSPGVGAFGTSAARARTSKAMGAKLLHIQAAHGPVRQSLDAHASRKPLSPNGPPPPRRSSSFNEHRPGGARLSAASSVITGAASVPVNDPNLVRLFRDRRSTTTTGTSGPAASASIVGYGSTGIPPRGSGGGSSSGGGGAEQPASQQQRDSATLRGAVGGRSRRTALLSGEPDLRSIGSEGGVGRGSPALVPSASGRLPDPHGTRMHAAARPSKMATPSAAAAAPVASTTAAGSAGDQRFARASGSHSFNQLSQQQSLEVRKHAPVAPVLSADFSRFGAAPPGSSGSMTSESRGIMGRLKGFFSQE